MTKPGHKDFIYFDNPRKELRFYTPLLLMNRPRTNTGKPSSKITTVFALTLLLKPKVSTKEVTRSEIHTQNTGRDCG